MQLKFLLLPKNVASTNTTFALVPDCGFKPHGYMT